MENFCKMVHVDEAKCAVSLMLDKVLEKSSVFLEEFTDLSYSIVKCY